MSLKRSIQRIEKDIDSSSKQYDKELKEGKHDLRKESVHRMGKNYNP